MKIIDCQQGDAAWHAHRNNPSMRNASDASAMMGCSTYVSRAELIKRVATGIAPEVDERTQERFDMGHRAEALARPRVETAIGQDLYPAVGVSTEYPHLSASFDGLTMDESLAWECKSRNADKVACVEQRQVVPSADYWQVVQQLVVSRAERVRYSLVNGNGEEEAFCEAELAEGDEAKLLAGWAQFDADVAAYVPEPAAAVVLAAPVESLPVVSVRMDGKIAVIDNLHFFGERLRAFVDRIDKEPSTDQAFADCEEAVKVLKRAEDALEAAEANALAQIDPVEAMRRTVADLNNLARSTRLLIEKVVKQRKEQLRAQVAADALTAYRAHLTQINATLSVSVQESPAFTGDVAGAIKGKRSLDNLRADVAQVVANYKIAASTEGNRHHANIAVLAHAGRAELFRDRDALVRGKQPEDLANLVQARIADADKAEQARLDAERAKIRQEEEARAQRDAEALAEQERQRIRKEEWDKLRAEAPVVIAQTQPCGPGPIQPQPARAPAANEIVTMPGQARPAETPAAVEATPEAAPVAAARPGATIKLGDINARIAPLSITGDGLALLGFKPVGTEKSAKLYSEADFHDICRAMGRVLKVAMEAPALEKAA